MKTELNPELAVNARTRGGQAATRGSRDLPRNTGNTRKTDSRVVPLPCIQRILRFTAFLKNLPRLRTMSTFAVQRSKPEFPRPYLQPDCAASWGPGVLALNSE